MKYRWPDAKIIAAILRHHFYLRRHTPRPSTMYVLHNLYPAVDWERVDFYEGLPWFTPMAAPYVSAQALPDFYSFRRYRIYLKKFDESRVQCLADIVHEGFHVMQAMSYQKGSGAGFFRTWMLLYLADFFRHGYRDNVFEIPAFDQEYRFLAFCESQGLHGIEPALTENTIRSLHFPDALVHRQSAAIKGLAWWQLTCSVLLCLLIAVCRPLMDVLLGIFALFVRKEKVNTQIL